MNIYRYSGIARPVDFNYPTNRLIALLAAVALLAGIAIGVIQGQVVGKILLLGLHFALTVFLTWALAREVDPHEPYSAFGAVALASAGFVWGIRPDLMSIALMMATARILIGSCSREATLLDRLTVAAGAAWLAFVQHQGLVVVMVSVAFLLDGVLQPAKRISLPLSGLILAMAIASFYLWPPIPNISTSVLNAKLLLLGLFVVYMFIAYRRQPAPSDNEYTSIAPGRLLALHVVLLVWVVFALPLYGQGAINKLLIVWAVIAAASIYAIALAMVRKKARAY